MEFKSLEASLGRTINWDVQGGVLRPPKFVDRWRILLWDHVFPHYFEEKSNTKFLMGTNLTEFEDGIKIIHRVLYRYFFFLSTCPSFSLQNSNFFHFFHVFCFRSMYHELLPKEALSTSFLPVYVEEWVLDSSLDFMYTDEHDVYPFAHLKLAG